MLKRTMPPASESVLLQRAQQLSGRNLGWIAQQYGVAVPADLRRSKGWIGQLLELTLGATASSKAVPDFPKLGIELKSIPVSPTGSPRESTYVCTAPIQGHSYNRWEDSWVRHKLSAVLWIPIVGEKKTPVAERIVGGPLLWHPNPVQGEQLRKDWEMLTEMIIDGAFDRISARHGGALHLRPKAANSREMHWVVGEDGEWAQSGPLGFYLRQSFTRGILQEGLLV